jgi:hypothetical protein
MHTFCADPPYIPFYNTHFIVFDFDHSAFNPFAWWSGMTKHGEGANETKSKVGALLCFLNGQPGQYKMQPIVNEK